MVSLNDLFQWARESTRIKAISVWTSTSDSFLEDYYCLWPWILIFVSSPYKPEGDRAVTLKQHTRQNTQKQGQKNSMLTEVLASQI